MPELGLTGLRPNDKDAALIGVPDRLRWEQWRLPARLRALQTGLKRKGEAPLDLLYSPALGAPLCSPIPVVAHVHDLIPLRYPEQFRGWAGWYWKRLLPASWRRSRLITVSNSWLVQEVSRHLAYPADRIHVVPYYADPALLELAEGLRPGLKQELASGDAGAESAKSEGPPVFICLGSHEARKNFALPIEALAVLKNQGFNARLRIIGGHTAHTAELQSFVQRIGVSSLVSFEGYMDRREIVAAMLEATALLFTSRYEGYGMPPQEAQSIGLPVVLSDIPCHRTVYDDDARWRLSAVSTPARPPFVDVNDTESLAGQMERLAGDIAWRRQLALDGAAYQRTFSEEATALALRDAFRAAAVAGS